MLGEPLLPGPKHRQVPAIEGKEVGSAVAVIVAWQQQRPGGALEHEMVHRVGESRRLGFVVGHHGQLDGALASVLEIHRQRPRQGGEQGSGSTLGAPGPNQGHPRESAAAGDQGEAAGDVNLPMLLGVGQGHQLQARRAQKGQFRMGAVGVHRHCVSRDGEFPPRLGVQPLPGLAGEVENAPLFPGRHALDGDHQHVLGALLAIAGEGSRPDLNRSSGHGEANGFEGLVLGRRCPGTEARSSEPEGAQHKQAKHRRGGWHKPHHT